MSTLLKSVLGAFVAIFATISAFAANVAKIGDTEYATIDEAMEVVPDNGTVELLTNVDLPNYFVYNGKNFTLDGKGFTLKCTKAHVSSNEKSAWRYFVNVNGGTQTYKNITIDANNLVPYAIQSLNANSSITLENVTIKNAKTTKDPFASKWWPSVALGYGIHVNNGGKVVATNLKVSNCEVADVYVENSSTFTLAGDANNVDVLAVPITSTLLSSPASVNVEPFSTYTSATVQSETFKFVAATLPPLFT